MERDLEVINFAKRVMILPWLVLLGLPRVVGKFWVFLIS